MLCQIYTCGDLLKNSAWPPVPGRDLFHIYEDDAVRKVQGFVFGLCTCPRIGACADQTKFLVLAFHVPAQIYHIAIPGRKGGAERFCACARPSKMAVLVLVCVGRGAAVMVLKYPR